MAPLERIYPVLFLIKVLIAVSNAYPADYYLSVPEITVNVVPTIDRDEYVVVEQPIPYFEAVPTYPIIQSYPVELSYPTVPSYPTSYYEYTLLPQPETPPIIFVDDNSGNDNNSLLYLLLLLKGFRGNSCNSCNNCYGSGPCNPGPCFGPVSPPCGCGSSSCGCGTPSYSPSCGFGAPTCGCGGNNCGCGSTSCGCGVPFGCGYGSEADWPVLSITFDPCPSCSCQS